MSYIFFPTPTPVFPTLAPLGWSVHRKVILASRIITGISGRETMLACAAYPRWAFTLTYGGDSWLREETQNITPDSTLSGLAELEAISGLYLECQGSYGEFYYDDPEDDSRYNQFVGLVIQQPSTTYPLFYSWGSGPFTPSLTFPVQGINTIDAVYVQGVRISSTLYSMDATNTQLVVNTSSLFPGYTITADFHFYYRCRFLDDNQDYNQFYRNLWELKEVRFESVKP